MQFWLWRVAAFVSYPIHLFAIGPRYFRRDMHLVIYSHRLKWDVIFTFLSWKYCLDYDDKSSHTSVIRTHYVFLLETLDVKLSGLVGQLYSDHVVSPDEAEDISSEVTSFRANEKLLSVLSRKSPQQFQLFLAALDNCGQQHVRNVVGLLINVSWC